MNIYLVLFIVFSVLNLVGFLWLAIVAFKRGVVWGLLVLLLSPITAIVFSLVNWFEARKPFLLYISTFLLSFGTLIFIYSQVGLGNMQQITEKMHKGELRPDQAFQLVSRAMQGSQGDLFAPQTKPVSPAADRVPQPKKQATKTDAKLASTQAKPTDPVATTRQVSAARPLAKADKPEAKAQAKPKTLASAAPTQDPPASTQPSNSDPADDPPSEPVPNINQVKPDPLVQKQKVPSDKVTVSLSRVSHYIGRYFIITLKNGDKQRGLLRKVDRYSLVLDMKLYNGSFVYRVRKGDIRKIQMRKRLSDNY
ncbi:MAG: hypothetical protein P8Z75_01165 [Gammaproteobacteria bacterium]